MTDLNGHTGSALVQPAFRKPPSSNQAHGDRLLVCKGPTRVWIPGPPMISDPQKPTAKLSFGGFEISLFPGPKNATVKPTPAETGDAKSASEQKPYGLAWGLYNWDTPKPADIKRNDDFPGELRGYVEALLKVQDAFQDLESRFSSLCKDVVGVKQDLGVPCKSEVKAETCEKKSDEAVTSHKAAPKHASAFGLQSLKESLGPRQKVAPSAHLFNPSFETDPPKHTLAAILNNAEAETSNSHVGANPFSKEDTKQASDRAPEGVMDAEMSKKGPAGSMPCIKEDAQRAWTKSNEGILYLPKKRSTGLVTLMRPGFRRSPAEYTSKIVETESSKKDRAGAPEMRGFPPRAKGKAPATSGSGQDDDGLGDIVNPPTPGRLHCRPYFVEGDELFWVIDNGGRYVKLPIRDIAGRAGQWSNTSCGEPFFICKGQAVRKSDLKFFKSLREDLEGEEGA